MRKKHIDLNNAILEQTYRECDLYPNEIHAITNDGTELFYVLETGSNESIEENEIKDEIERIKTND